MHTKLHQTAPNAFEARVALPPGRSVDAIAAAGVLLLGVLLCLIGSGLLEQFKEGAARRQELNVEELLAAAAAVAGAGVVAWWIVSMLCAFASALLERKGRLRAAAATRRLSPAFMQRLVLGALSIQLLSGPVAHAAVTAPGPEWAPTERGSSSAPAVPGTEQSSTGQPGTEQASAEQSSAEQSGAERTGAEHTSTDEASMAGAEAFPSAPVTGNAQQQAPVQVPDAGGEAPALAAEQAAVPEQTLLPEQTAARDVIPPPAFHPGWQPAAPVVNPGILAGPATRASAQEVEPHVEGVTVHAGDSLWDIAARHLGHGASDLDIALHWPRWYEANRELIGRNPDVLLPGQILQPPSSGQN